MAISSPNVVSTGKGMSAVMDAFQIGASMVQFGQSLKLERQKVAEAQRQFDVKQSTEQMWKLVEAAAPSTLGGARGVLENLKPSLVQQLSLMLGVNTETATAMVNDLFNSDLSPRALMESAVLAQMDYNQIVTGPGGMAEKYLAKATSAAPARGTGGISGPAEQVGPGFTGAPPRDIGGIGGPPEQVGIESGPRAEPEVSETTAPGVSFLSAEAQTSLDASGLPADVKQILSGGVREGAGKIAPKVLSETENIDIEEPAPKPTPIVPYVANPHITTVAAKTKVADAISTAMDSAAVQDINDPRSLARTTRAADQGRRLAQQGMSTQEKLRAAVDYYTDPKNLKKVYTQLGGGDAEKGEQLFWDMYNGDNEAYIERIKADSAITVAGMQREIESRKLAILERVGGVDSDTAAKIEIAHIQADAARAVAGTQAAQRADESLDESITRLLGDLAKMDAGANPVAYKALGEQIAHLKSTLTGKPWEFYSKIYESGGIFNQIMTTLTGKRGVAPGSGVMPKAQADALRAMEAVVPKENVPTTDADAAKEALQRKYGG